MEFNPVADIVEELGLPEKSVYAVLRLFAEGNTVPFIARYRKEVTGNLDEVQIRNIQERHTYLAELHDRKQTILESIGSQGKLTDALRKAILACQSKTTLEDLYLPYKPKRRTRAMIARERGLEPLADRILEQPLAGDPDKEAEAFVDEEIGVGDIAAALAGARDIVAEAVAENADVRRLVREIFADEGIVTSKVAKGKEEEAVKYKDYYEFQERVSKIPSHRYLAIRRGEKEGMLYMHIEIPCEPTLREIYTLCKCNRASPFAEQMRLAVDDGFKRLILPSVETDVRVDLKMEADRAAVAVFAENLRHLLLASPLGTKSVIGIDPGLRTGCKCAALDATGKFLETMTFYVTGGADREMRTAKELVAFIKRHRPYAIAIGNGTASREAEAFVKKLIQAADIKDVIVVQVNESGASVYSASDVAREEFPELDLTIRGAISIARRLQDPLAELVKVDPKSIGVGQYQHDVYQQLLHDNLRDVVESCVNFVGVELNTASQSLLSYVSGIGATLAKKIVDYRDAHGAFTSRHQLLEVPGLGPRTFQQSAGFLRVQNSDHPLDASAVHPESYDVVEMIIKDVGRPLAEVVGNKNVVDAIDVRKYVCDVGELTLKDILDELRKPGRDPRSSFEMPAFRDDVSKPSDLKVGMVLEGIVTNVTAFGAFVDIGVHQDGLVHVSQLSDSFVSDPAQIVRAGDRIKVKVLEVDLQRNRISLSAKQQQQQASKAKTKSFSSSPFSTL
ncbi:MAG: RNA-binding transcriptional accessory protein [Chlamydiales bacterium]|nr:RNA-binding transcriptional accessory protein [Chlamydiia bacterium]MCP5508746.1 RNA-binding transcriptional accessory protein [Chlamydiales bacterium]